MNTPIDHLNEPPHTEDLAGEYVLGVLGAAQRRAAEDRIAREPAFSREVADWEGRLAPLIDEIAPVPAPYALWPRIRAAVGLGDVAHARPPQRTDDARPGLWQSAPFWRWLSAGAFSAVAASLVALLLLPRVVPTPQQPPPEPTIEPLVAKMVQEDGKALFLATVDSRHGTMVVQPTSVEIPVGRVPELWLIPPGDSPHSLGLIDPARPNAVVVPKALLAALGPHAIVAVTVEPPGGGPGGKPSGPIIAKGEIALL